ncbi:MAG: GNAT family N-acetyltransferase [Bacilli bacterium]|nr:GNAT family N-acetyltransferase [Bacilli bacterium]
MKVTLQTERLTLRPWKIEDAPEMFQTWAKDPEVTKYLTWNYHENEEQTKQVIEIWLKQYEKPERINFAITLKDGTLIGGIDVVGYIDKVPVIGYNLGVKYWNKGYMTEACKAVLGYLKSLGYSKVRIDAMENNVASIRVIEKCGGVFQNKEMEELPNKKRVEIVNRYIVFL